ncbi:MAG TPA: thioesterase family protein [Solirubrobacteraceae bacterium]|nr:thioesterase family protein [Solirubrobacteraceae bacterium]
MSAAETAYYVDTGGGTFEPTRATESPWDRQAQHGGPPCALLARAIRAVDPDPGYRIVRMTVELLGVIPRRPCRVEAAISRAGRRVRMIDATLFSPDRSVATARAWQIMAGGADVPVPAPVEEPVPGPQPQRYFAGLDEWGYGESIEWRFASGGYDEPGPATVWTRCRLPLLDGEPLHPLDRALLVADSANGISGVLPQSDWLFVPPAVTVTVHRYPVGEWVRLSAQTTLAADGIGSTVGGLGDTRGPIGSVTQPLLVARR